MSVLRESRRLSRAFAALVLAAVPAAALAQACGDDNAVSPDASTGMTPDGQSGDGAAGDGGTPPSDAPHFGIDAACITIAEIINAPDDALPDADLGCRYTLPCGLPDSSGYTIIGCDFYMTQTVTGTDASIGCWFPEGQGCQADVYVPNPNGSAVFECSDCFGGGGRRPSGLLASRRDAAIASPVGAYFARMAHDEAASVHAFRVLREELAQLGAPPQLTAAAQRSERDEVRHARMMERRALAHGSAVPSPRVRRRSRARSLESIARENAVEGCIHETYGALQMHFQAANAGDASLRPLFARIAADETRHAALSWIVAEWVESRLTAAARARVEAARRRALRSLRRTLDRQARASFDSVVGRPAREHAVALLDGMTKTLRGGAQLI